jgi:hypothetical protein
MLPIVRRIRRPLLPSDPPKTAPVPQSSAVVPPASPQSAPALSPAPSEGRAGSPSTPRSDSPNTENRSDFGQKWSDSIPSPPSDSRAYSPGTPSTLETFNHQPSTLNPQHAWSFHPDELAADYQIFTAWLQLSAPRRFAKAATALGCSVYRLRRLSARHNWKTRAAAFDNHRANAASLALDQLLRDEVLDWKERAERFRLQEWLLHEEMLQAASEAVRELRKHPGRASLNDIVKVIDLAFILGRTACGMPLEPAKPAEFEPPFSQPDIEAALNKIYGQNDPSESAASPGAVP